MLEVLVLIAYAQMPLINAHAEVSSKARDIHFVLSLHLQPYFVYAISEGSGESAHMCRLICADSPEPLLLTDMICFEISLRRFF